jgi:hypothetical protein
VLHHERAITGALYEHFLGFPATARFFLPPDGTPDHQRLKRRRHSLGRWLRETAEAALTHDFAYHLLAIGLSHSHRSHRPGGEVPPHFTVATMSLAPTALDRLLQGALLPSGNPHSLPEGEDIDGLRSAAGAGPKRGQYMPVFP